MSAIDLITKSFSEALSSEDYEALFSELEESLASRASAREKLFFRLNEEPKDTKSRLLLAKIYYVDGLAEFAVRELVELKKYSEVESVDRLIDSFGAFGQAYLTSPGAAVEDNLVAELDVDMDIVSTLDELDGE